MPFATADFCRMTLRRLGRDRRGAMAVTMALATTVLLGFAGAGIDIAVWETSKRDMQGAADQAAFSAAISSGAGGSHAADNAKAVTASMGFVHGQQGVTVTVNNPPATGGYAGNSLAWEVIVRKPQRMRFAGVFLGSQPTASARAVAVPAGGTYCMLILDPTASGALNLQGNPNLSTPNCSIQVNSNSASAVYSGGSGSITANTLSIVGGYSIGNASHIYASVTTGASAVADPYASRTIPSYLSLPCITVPNFGNHQTVTLVPGRYCNGINVGNGTLILQPGTYILDRGQLSTNGGSITGNGVTLVLTSSTGSNYATVSLGGNSTVDLKTQSSGSLSGILFFQDRNAPASTTNNLTGGSNQKFTGALYFPSTSVNYGGSAASQYCTQLIAKAVAFQGDSSFKSECGSVGTTTITNNSVKMAE